MLFGLVEIAGCLQRNSNLRRQRARAANILRRDAGSIQPVQHTKHAQDLTLRVEQRDGQQLPHLELGQRLQIYSWDLARIVRPEDFPGQQRLADGPSGKDEVYALGAAIFGGPTHMEGAFFQQSDEAAGKAEEIRCAQSKSLQELVKLADRAKFRGNVQQLMEI